MFYMEIEPIGARRVDPKTEPWDEEIDVAVVGFGGAGACAAIEAAEQGAKVMIVDRFDGGGATAISGGIVYAGGGTAHQRAAGFTDDNPAAMYAYLKHEVGDAVSSATLKRFCDHSADNLTWLENHGVRFSHAYCPVKTSYPLDQYNLYYSGNEGLAPYRDHAAPAPRGHRPVGKGLPGASLYEPLRQAAIKLGVDARYSSRVTRLLVDDRGGVVGFEMHCLDPRSLAGRKHRFLHRWAKRIAPFVPRLALRMRDAIGRIEIAHGKLKLVRVLRGTVLSAGGFVMNRKMVEHHAPLYRRGMPLGQTGCDGSGIRLGSGAGAGVDRMDRVSAWRFINPPLAFAYGMLVDRAGHRYVNEMQYGATIGHHMVNAHKGEAFLILDANGVRDARKQSGPGKAQWFQWVPALLNIYTNSRRAPDIAALARACRIDAGNLAATVTTYNACAAGEQTDPFGKDREHMRALSAPFIAIDCSINSKRFPCPTLTLGGLVVDEDTGQVRNDKGHIGGLFAAGRNAVGVSSELYVSGLSLADCVFSGRRAGEHAARNSNDSAQT
jgi:3-oxo-5alpha-steroid 4-dehydrogenase